MAKTITLRYYRMCLRKYTNQKGNYYVWGNLLTKYKWAMQVNFSWLRVEWIIDVTSCVQLCKDHKIETVWKIAFLMPLLIFAKHFMGMMETNKSIKTPMILILLHDIEPEKDFIGKELEYYVKILRVLNIYSCLH